MVNLIHLNFLDPSVQCHNMRNKSQGLPQVLIENCRAKLNRKAKYARDSLATHFFDSLKRNSNT